MQAKRSIAIECPEETWFAREEAERRRARERDRQRAALAAELRLPENDEAVAVLFDAGIDARTLLAVEWIPMVLVAWADGAVQPAERAAILRAARADGLPLGHPARAMLELWLEQKPSPDRVELWNAYLRALARADGEDALLAHAAWMRETAREVAESEGGWLGFARVSGAESSLIDELIERVDAARAG
jgi:hypothetical protein